MEINSLSQTTTVETSRLKISFSKSKRAKMSLSKNLHEAIAENIISVLIRLDIEAHKPGISTIEYVRRAQAIERLLKKVEDDFDIYFMVKVFKEAGERIGRTIGPLSNKILKKLLSSGCVVTKIKKCTMYEK